MSGKKMIQGMDIAIITTAQSQEESRFLLERLGIPFRKIQS